MYKAKYFHPQPRTGADTVLHLKLYDGLMTTGKVFDYSLNGNTGTLVDTDDPITLVPAYPGFDFDGANDWITVGAAGDFDYTTEDFSISMWVKWDVATNDTLFWKGDQNDKGYYLEVRDDNKIRFTTSGGGINQATKSTNTVTVGEWTRIAITRSGASVKIYKNGVECAYDDVGVHVNPDTSNNITRIGNYSDGAFNWNGKIDDVMVHTRVLSATEELSNYHLTRYRYQV